MAFTANEIKNLALQEINHETISDWSDSSNTDIPIINSQYALAKSVALTMYQWSWAFKYAKLEMAYNPGWFALSSTLPTDFVNFNTINTVTTMPTPGANKENLVYWYKGNTTSSFTNNKLYVCLKQTTPSTTYYWGEYVFGFSTDSTGQNEIDDFYVLTDSNLVYSDKSVLYIKYLPIDSGGEITTTTYKYTRLDLEPATALAMDTPTQYKYRAQLPSDFIGYLSAFTNSKLTILADYVTVGSMIYTNSEDVYLKYISSVDESVFPPEFVDWFKIFVAQRINGYLNGDMQRQQLLNGEEPFYFRKAKNIDSKRNKHDSLSGNPFLWVRGKVGGGI